MNKISRFLFKKYAAMSGDKKISLALQLSEQVRAVRQAGAQATNTANKNYD